MSEPPSPAPLPPAVPAAPAARQPLQLLRLPVDKPQPAVTFLQSRSRGVMDLIAHFWEGLVRTPPLQRPDLHLVVATTHANGANVHTNMSALDPAHFSGAMLYVPKAHRADVLALDQATAAAFAAYIGHQGPRVLAANGGTASSAAATTTVASAPISTAVSASAGGLSQAGGATASGSAGPMPITNGIGEEVPEGYEVPSVVPLTDFSAAARNGAADATELPAEPQVLPRPAGGGVAPRVPIDFLTGHADGIHWMTPLLLPLVHKRAPARQLVNVVMQLPAMVPAEADPAVRLAREADIPQLNRWRRLYKEERGIVFDADMGALIEHQRVFVYEVDKQIVAVAKIDLELHSLVEIGGVYTFPEYRKRGFGAGIVRDLAVRIRAQGKTPTLQVDVQNLPALQLYEKAGWEPMGKLARVWLTG